MLSEPAVFPSTPSQLPSSHNIPASNDMDVDVDFDTNDSAMPGENESLLLPTTSLLASWRALSSDMPESARSKPRNVVDVGHDARILGDVRRHEAKMAKLWTNNNFRVLSQLMNSLSLSQSDIDRVLNAVGPTTYYIVADNIIFCRLGESIHPCQSLSRTDIYVTTRTMFWLPLRCEFWTCLRIRHCPSPLITCAWFLLTSKWLA